MMLHKMGSVSLLTSSAALLLAGLVWGQGAASVDPIDAGKPDTWDQAVLEANDHVSRVARALILVAKDEKRTAEDRAKAIGLLGKIGNKESLDFLVSNTSLELSLRVGGGHVESMKRTPCLYAIFMSGRNWAVAQAILESFSQPRPELEVGDLSKMFVQIMRPDVARAIASYELADKPTGDHEKNLLHLKRVAEGG